MEIFIQYTNRSLISIDINDLDTINLLKVKLFQQEKIPFSKQILYWNNQELLGTKTLDDYKIKRKSIITLIVLPCPYCEIDKNIAKEYEESNTKLYYVSQNYEDTLPFLSI